MDLDSVVTIWGKTFFGVSRREEDKGARGLGWQSGCAHAKEKKLAGPRGEKGRWAEASWARPRHGRKSGGRKWPKACFNIQTLLYFLGFDSKSKWIRI
jgi:hypothetical protein